MVKQPTIHSAALRLGHCQLTVLAVVQQALAQPCTYPRREASATTYRSLPGMEQLGCCEESRFFLLATALAITG